MRRWPFRNVINGGFEVSDIVERLRDPVGNWNSGGRFEAADEIERLRAVLKNIADRDPLAPGAVVDYARDRLAQL